MNVKPIGIIHSPFTQAAGTPINVRVAKGVRGRVEVFTKYAGGLKDLKGFDRVWLIFHFDRARRPRLVVTPFLDTVKRGVFATRAPSRPNRIGISCVGLLRIRKNILYVSDLDILDGTPLLDIKPYTPSDCFEGVRFGWMDNVPDRRMVADGRFASQKRRKGIR